MTRFKSQAARSRITSRGFSLIELLIVVAIILVIAAIAIPNFLRSKMAANETASVANLRNITTANVVYSSTYGTGFAATLAALGPGGGGGGASPSSAHAALIDDVLAAGTKSGYTYVYAPAPADSAGIIPTYTVNANPISPGVTATRYFFTDESGVIRQNLTATATASDTPIN